MAVACESNFYVAQFVGGWHVVFVDGLPEGIEQCPLHFLPQVVSDQADRAERFSVKVR